MDVGNSEDTSNNDQSYQSQNTSSNTIDTTNSSFVSSIDSNCTVINQPTTSSTISPNDATNLSNSTISNTNTTTNTPINNTNNNNNTTTTPTYSPALKPSNSNQQNNAAYNTKKQPLNLQSQSTLNPINNKLPKHQKAMRSPLLPSNTLSHSHSSNFHSANLGSASHQRQYVLLRDKSDPNHSNPVLQSPIPSQAAAALHGLGSNVNNNNNNNSGSSSSSSNTNSGTKIYSPMLTPNLTPSGLPGTPTLSRKRPSLMRVPSSKYVFSVDDHEDEIEGDLNREYLEGYSDALRNRFKRSLAHAHRSESPFSRDPNLIHDQLAPKFSRTDLKALKNEELEQDILNNLNATTKELNVLKEREAAENDANHSNNNHIVNKKSLVRDDNDFDQIDISLLDDSNSRLYKKSSHHFEDIEGDIDDLNTEDDLDNDSISSVESFTLRERQDAINETHPFGIRIWKPAIYKKIRSVQKAAETDIHSTPQVNRHISSGVLFCNFLWKLSFGLIFFISCLILSFITLLFAMFTNPKKNDSMKYCKLYFNIGLYLFNPFGKIVCLKRDVRYINEDAGVGTSLDEFRRWRNQNEERLFYAAPTATSSGANASNTNNNNNNNNNKSNSSPKKSPNLLDETTPLHLDIPDTTTKSNITYNSTDQESIDPQHSNEQWGTLNAENRANDKGDDDDEIDEDDDNVTFYKQRLFGRGSWNIGRVIFYILYYITIQPLILVFSFVLWLLVFTIPMAKVLVILGSHIRRHPLALSFQDEKEYTKRIAGVQQSTESILICTYRSIGLHYYKYTVDGTNIFFINMLFLVILTIFDFFFVKEYLGFEESLITNSEFIFVLCLVSIVPLAYFIGQAVASISAQTSMGLGAVINAFFSTIVEIFLYCVALDQSKGKLVEGSMLGSILAGVLLLPGTSMCGGAIRRKTQRYNPASAGVSSTMLMFSILVMMAPTILYEIYGQYEVECFACSDISDVGEDCRRCHFFQPSLAADSLYLNYLRPFTILCAIFLFLAYCIGLWFTLKTHAALIWSTPTITEKKGDINPTVLKSPNVATSGNASGFTPSIRSLSLDNGIKQRRSIVGNKPPLQHQFSQQSQPHLSVPDSQQQQQQQSVSQPPPPPPQQQQQQQQLQPAQAQVAHDESNGHDAPNWSRRKSTTILLSSTVLYAIIAEILVDVVDDVLSVYPINPKFLGLTIFALVPNTTEFVNAISFAMNGNVALSMEIGSAYALQVCLLQIPVVTVYSVYNNFSTFEIQDINKMFTLIFPRWDFFASLISVYMFTYIYAEGKSNYFKGSILILLYFVVLAGFYYADQIDTSGLPMIQALTSAAIN